MKILANDGISPEAIKTLEEAGFEVITTKVTQNQLADFINKEGRNPFSTLSYTGQEGSY